MGAHPVAILVAGPNADATSTSTCRVGPVETARRDAYTKMFYKNNNSFGLRVAGGFQIFSICDKRLEKPDLETESLST
jgi:hypothetical protein